MITTSFGYVVNFQCNWDGIQVQPGQTMSTRHLRFAPRFTLNVDPESTFTLIMIGEQFVR